MNIEMVIDYLSNKLGYQINSDYYKNIATWEDWWRGYHERFHKFVEVTAAGAKNRKLYSLRMAKKIPEDWAAILLNEKTEIVIEDEASSRFVLGDKTEAGTGGVFGANDFWTQGNALIEKAFYSGTGAFLLKLRGMDIAEDGAILQNAGAAIGIDYLPATNIIPLTTEGGTITEVAFASEVIRRGKPFVYIEMHLKEQDGYVIHNSMFHVKDNKMEPAALPPGVAETFKTGWKHPLFAIVTPNIVNNISGNNGLGISVYANAIDNLEGVDLAYNNFNRDFKLGGKKVFYSAELIERDDNGNAITPDDLMQQLFLSVGDPPVDENGNNRLLHEYNPALRVAENKDGVQAQLDYLSFKCGLGTKHYQFNGGTVVTATQYTGDKQDLVQNANKHYIPVEKALQTIVRAILWAGEEILGEAVNPDTKIRVNFEDSYIIDKESERVRDLQEVNSGIMPKWEYRMKWRGEDEATAKRMIEQGRTNDELMGFE